MDISYSLAMEDHARINPLQGLEALAEKLVPTDRKMQPGPTKAEVKDQNAAAMAQLNAMMANVQKRKPPAARRKGVK